MKRASLLIAAGVVLLVCLALWALHNGRAESELRLGGYIEAEQIQVGSKLAGRVARIGQISAAHSEALWVDEGVEVDAGQELVVFETDDVEAQLAEARAQWKQAVEKLRELEAKTRQELIDEAKAKVNRLTEKWSMMKSGPRPEETEQARLLYERSRADYENARTEHNRQVALVERGAGSASALDAARKLMEMSMRAMEADKQKYEMLAKGYRDEEVEMARHEKEEAEAALRLAINGPLPQEIEQARAAVDAAAARIQRLEVLLDEGTVRAPAQPGLSYIVEAFDLQVGDMVPAGAPLATLVRKDQLWVRAFVPETDLGLIQDNQSVAVSVDSFPGRRFQGTVLRVNRVAEFTPRNVQTFKERQDMLFGIKIRVTDPKGVLRPGMAATVYVPKN